MAEGGTGPLPSYRRGLVFQAEFQTCLTVNNLLLNHTWTITMWIRPLAQSGNIFSINTNVNSEPGSENYINLMMTTGFRPQMNIAQPANDEFMAITGAEGQILEADWAYVAFCTVWDAETRTSTYSVAVNLNESVSDVNPMMFTDDPTHGKLIGAENNVEMPGSFVKKTFYVGMLWNFCVYGTYKEPHDEFIAPPDSCGVNECVDCPAGPECLIDCEWNEFRDPDTFECLPCKEDCLEGCMVAENCNVCTNEKCAVCPEWEGCEECIENAEFRPEPDCQCIESYSYDSETNTCSQCHPACKECDLADDISCTSCNEGYYLVPDTSICMQHCPTGYTEDPATATCIGETPDEVSCVIFNLIDVFDWDYDVGDELAHEVNYIGGLVPIEREGSEPI